MPRPTSAAKLGPERTATGRDGPDDLADQLGHPQERAFFEPLGRADDRDPGFHERHRAHHHIARPVRGQRADHQVGAAERTIKIRCGADILRKNQLWQVRRIRAAFSDGVGEGRISRPQTDRMACACEVHGERRAKAASPKNGRLLLLRAFAHHHLRPQQSHCR